jgi:hypothetical protein
VFNEVSTGTILLSLLYIFVYAAALRRDSVTQLDAKDKG